MLIIGCPRSGTTWLARIFDSHPGVIYRHEPDAVLDGPPIPQFPEGTFSREWRDAARRHLDAMARSRHVRAVGLVPVFPKRYHSPLQRSLRVGCIYAIKGMERATGLQRLVDRLAVPDLLPADAADPVTVVMKSVIANGRAGLFHAAWPALRIILIVRHPCAQIASMIRGSRMRKLSGGGSARTLSGTRIARDAGIDEAWLRQARPEQSLAWYWRVVNDHTMNDLDGSPAFRAVRYEDLCHQPLDVARDLFDFAGLDFDPACEAFVRQSVSPAEDAEAFFATTRNPEIAATKWRQQLSAAQIDDIEAITADTRAGRLFRPFLDA